MLYRCLFLLWQCLESGVSGVLTDLDGDDVDEVTGTVVLELFILSDVLKWGDNNVVLEKDWNNQSSIIFSEIKKEYNDSGDLMRRCFLNY